MSRQKKLRQRNRIIINKIYSLSDPEAMRDMAAKSILINKNPAKSSFRMRWLTNLNGLGQYDEIGRQRFDTVLLPFDRFFLGFVMPTARLGLLVFDPFLRSI
jgi:hypothetical protein